MFAFLDCSSFEPDVCLFVLGTGYFIHEGRFPPSLDFGQDWLIIIMVFFFVVGGWEKDKRLVRFPGTAG